MAPINEWLRKPEYLCRPMQIFRRLGNAVRPTPKGWQQVTLPWGLPMRVRPSEGIGAAIWRAGVYDLAVTEVIYRLLDDGDHAVDIGTNIGQMSSVMAFRCGPTGRVDSYEPHPSILDELRHNVALWAGRSITTVTVHAKALSATSGRATLNIADDFETNQGGSFIGDRPPSSSHTKHRSIEVETVRLDNEFHDSRPIGLIKIDVEGHEMAVLRGGTELFDRKVVRDVVFEEHDPYPTRVTAYFEDREYTVLRIGKNLAGLDIRPPGQASVVRHSFDPPNYLATVDPDRARRRLGTNGWRSLAGK